LYTEFVEELSARGAKIAVMAAQPTMVPGRKPVAPLIQRARGGCRPAHLGVEYLRERKCLDGLGNLEILPFHPFEEMPDWLWRAS
jgi:hypothetical protein